MANYQPISRRPIAEVFRRTARGATRRCVATGLSADAISYFSMIAAMGAALCFWQSLRHPFFLLLAPLLCDLRLWCNMLDGMVALAAGQASPRGEVLNDLPDRFSDVVIFVGVAHSGWVDPLLGYWAALASLGTAYVGTLAQAVGAPREFAGPMSKPWRMVVLQIGAWLAFGLGGAPLKWACGIVIAGCALTIARRLRRTFRALART